MAGFAHYLHQYPSSVQVPGQVIASCWLLVVNIQVCVVVPPKYGEAQASDKKNRDKMG